MSLIVGLLVRDYLTFDMLLIKISQFSAFIEQFKAVAAIVYVAVYVAVVAFSVPAATILTIIGGYTFGGLLGGTVAFLGALLGASLLFLIVQAGLRPKDKKKIIVNPLFADFEAQISKNQFRYLLFLRFAPIFPFWMVNLAPPILGVRFNTFFLTTFVGIMPGTFIIAGLGQTLQIVSEPSTDLVYELISNPKFLVFFGFLSFVTIFPILWRILGFKKAESTKKL